jgi:hypothetical protein
MPAYYQITFLPAGRTQEFAGSRGNYYRLPGGSEIQLSSRPVWCHRCGEVTNGEEIESVDAIDRRIAQLERLAEEIRREMTLPPTPDAPGDRFQQEQIAEFRLRRKWREQRESPPKCLICGSIDLVALEHGKAVRIGDGSVRCECIGMCSTNFMNRYYSPHRER